MTPWTSVWFLVLLIARASISNSDYFNSPIDRPPPPSSSLSISMGLNESKRVEKSLRSSPDFDAACQSVYDRCLADAQHAFPGIRPYQLASAAAHLHATLSASLPLVRRWVPSPPAQAQVDAALRRVDPEAEALGPAEFWAFSAELFKDAILAGAGSAVLWRVPIGVAGIAGVGMVTHAGAEVVGRVMGVYAAGVVAAVFLSLS